MENSGIQSHPDRLETNTNTVGKNTIIGSVITLNKDYILMI